MPDSQVESCSILSAQAKEPLFGTATPSINYLLLEYHGTWGNKAFEESNLPSEVKERLFSISKEIPLTKLLVIKNREASKNAGYSFFIASCSEIGAALYWFQLPQYQDLLALDIPAILRGEAHQEQKQQTPLFLVCTNGRRDACCSRFGMQVYNSLFDLTAKENPLAAWECSHVGGHRFATNLIVLPYGLCYGRVEPGELSEILQFSLQAQLMLPRLRGRTCYQNIVQAADYFLRTNTGEKSLDAYLLMHAIELEPNDWQVSFLESIASKLHIMSVRTEKSSQEVYESCLGDKKTRWTQFTCLDHTVKVVNPPETL